MAQAKVIMKALRVRKILKRMAKAKVNTIREMVGLPPEQTWYQKCCDHMSSAFRELMCRTFCPCCVGVSSVGEFCCSPGSFGFKCCTDGFYPNTLMKNFLGFLFGLLLSMAIYFFLCMQLEANMEFALVLCIFLGCFLSLGMAFFIGVRCIVYLALPNFCSSKGRSFLLMYAMVLVMNHPVQNFSHNMDVLSNAVTCGQSMALNETRELLENAASPLLAVIDGIRTMMEHIKQFAGKIRDAFKCLLRAMQEIFSTIARVFQWLAGMTDVCNERMGQPYRKCKKAFDDGYNSCCDALGILDFICGIVTLVSHVCNLARIGELLCLITDAIKQLVIEKIGPPIMEKINDVKEMFYFNVSVDYHFHYNMNQSRPYSEIKDAILNEIKEKLSVFDFIQAIVDNLMCFTVLLVVVKAVLYRRGYLHKDHFDNVYLTKYLYEIDVKRIDMDKESLFPLRFIETLKYIPSFSYYMTKSEIKKLLKGLLFWLFAAFNASYYIVCDYGMYWILDLVRRHLDVRTSTAVPPHLQLHVKGQGPMADMYKAMIGVVEPVSDSGLNLDTSPCLPNPCVPNFQVYKTIASIIILCLFLNVFEAYFLRLRHVVGSIYYPHRERARAVWLYNHILMSRDGFLIFARRQLQRKFKDEKSIENLSFISRLEKSFPLLKRITELFGRKRKYCLCCSREAKASDMENFVHCVNCKSPYCNECFINLGNVCTACMNPLDYGDPDDVETDSSQDEEDKTVRVASLKARKQTVVKKQEDKTKRQNNMLKAFQKRFALKDAGGGDDEREPGTARGGDVDVEGQPDAEDGDEEAVTDEEEGAGEAEDVESEPTSEYNTDYQYGEADTTSEDEAPPRRTSLRKKVDKVSLDIFSKEDEDSS